MHLLETERLTLRPVVESDAALILALMNDPAFIQYVADRGLRTSDDAARYIAEKMLPGFRENGFGMNVVALKESGIPIGTCGLFKRKPVDDLELGFAFLRDFWGQGFAYEAASAMMAHGSNALGSTRIVAATSPNNVSSINLLEKLGLRFERLIFDEATHSELKLFGWNASLKS